MGEYARRISDNQEVKIGTCEFMYYIRYDDRNLVSKLPNSLDPVIEKNLFWRLPYPDEDHIKIGEYKGFDRGYVLNNYIAPETAKNFGTILIRSEMGILVNVVCYHGERLPVDTEEVSFHWNGKVDFYELAHVKNLPEEIKPIIRCRGCGHIWNCEWEEILPFIKDIELKDRLEKYQAFGKSCFA